jgi:hypothetical protein
VNVEKKATVANRSVTTEQYVTIWNPDSYGVKLGDLRKLVARAEGIPDDAEVLIEDLVAHYSIKDMAMAKRISVRHRDGSPVEP